MFKTKTTVNGFRSKRVQSKTRRGIRIKRKVGRGVRTKHMVKRRVAKSAAIKSDNDHEHGAVCKANRKKVRCDIIDNINTRSKRSKTSTINRDSPRVQSTINYADIDVSTRNIVAHIEKTFNNVQMRTRLVQNLTQALITTVMTPLYTPVENIDMDDFVLDPSLFKECDNFKLDMDDFVFDPSLFDECDKSVANVFSTFS